MIDLETMAKALEESGDYRILRRIQPRPTIEPPAGCRIGVVLDTETTGLDHNADEIIELGMIKFAFSPDGEVLGALDTFQAFREPLLEISAEITAITGITMEMVAGCEIDPQAMENFVADARIVIAHNAAFDRRFVERVWPVFADLAWACSLAEVDWKAHGFEGSRLGYLLSGCGLFHDGHRADADCLALLEVLAAPLGSTGRSALAALLESARADTVRIWATNAPFAKKDLLKARGYRWSDGADGSLKAWLTDVRDADLAAERAYLHAEIYGYEAHIPMKRHNAFSRYSAREA